MVKITNIRPAVRTPDRFNIFVDGKYSFSLSADQIIDTGVKTGDQLDIDMLEYMKRLCEQGKRYARLCDLIMRRPRSEYELMQYGYRKAWTPDETKLLIQGLKRKGYVDDRAFAEFWVRGRSNRNMSRRRILMELRQKGISDDISSQVIDSLDIGYDEQEALVNMIERKSRRYPDKNKLMAYLVRQGFSYESIKQAFAGEDGF